MSYALITVTIKPADTVWFGISEPDTAKRITDWTKIQPGFVTGSVQRIAPNTSQNIVIFDTQEHLTAYVTALATNADELAKQAYKAAHNQTSTQIQI